MGTLAKIFVVLNMILALCFTVASLTTYAKRIHWVEQMQKAVEESNTIYNKWQETQGKYDALVQQHRVDSNQWAQEKEQFTEIIDLKNKETEHLKSVNDEQAKAITQIEVRLDDLNKELAKKEERNRELQASLDKELQEKAKLRRDTQLAQTRAIEIMADLKEAEEELMQVSQTNSRLVQRVAVLSDALDRYVRTYGEIPEAMTATSVEPINGRVLQVNNKIRLVILSIGEKDGVKKGMEFVVSRGDTYLGKVRVRTVYDDMCSATIIPGMTPDLDAIKVQDAAQLLPM